MSIISNEHQSGSPFECPGCFRARCECECQPKPEAQPALPVDLSELDRLCAEHESTGRWMHYADALMNDWPAISAELRTLRARVGELEDAASGALAERDELVETADELAYSIGSIDEIGEHTNLNDPWANAVELAHALNDRAESAEARVKELEAWVRDAESDARADAEMLHKRDDRIISLESELAEARLDLERWHTSVEAHRLATILEQRDEARAEVKALTQELAAAREEQD